MRSSALAHAHPSEASVHCGQGRTRRPHRRPALGPASVGRPATPARLASGPRVSCNEPGGGARRPAIASRPVRAGPRHARRFGPAAPSPLGLSGGRLERPEAEPAAALAAAKGLPPVRMELSPTMQIAASWRCIFFGGGSAFLLHPVGLEGPRSAGGAILPATTGQRSHTAGAWGTEAWGAEWDSAPVRAALDLCRLHGPGPDVPAPAVGLRL